MTQAANRIKALDQAKFITIVTTAETAGHLAAKCKLPTPMVVQEVGLDDKPYAGSKSWYVPEGPCGFAWITIRPGNSPFANFMKKTGRANKAYGGGVSVWVGAFGQSVERKEAYAQAYAKVLQSYGIQAYADSRLD